MESKNVRNSLDIETSSEHDMVAIRAVNIKIYLSYVGRPPSCTGFHFLKHKVMHVTASWFIGCFFKFLFVLFHFCFI